MAKILINILAFSVAIVAGFYLLQYSLTASERAECYRLQKQAEEFKNAGFYLTQGQAVQCNEVYKIMIEANILK